MKIYEKKITYFINTAPVNIFSEQINQNISNADYYLEIGSRYWTMTPSDYAYADYFSVAFVGGVGSFGVTQINELAALRPVININKDVLISGGDGTASNPYIID